MTRRAPKRALPLAAPAPQRWTPALLEAVAAGEAAVLGPVLREGSAEAPEEAARLALGRALELARTSVVKEPPAQPIACRDRCSVCCFAKVVVTAPEVLRIAAHLRRTLDAAAFAALVERVRAADERIRGLSRAARAEARVTCPLLQEGSCGVHPVRPLICAGWNSLDAGACERYWEAPAEQLAPVHHSPSYELASAVLAGLGKACFDAGLDGTPLELIAALRIALERPNAGERWQRRLPVFSTAHDQEWLDRSRPR